MYGTNEFPLSTPVPQQPHTLTPRSLRLQVRPVVQELLHDVAVASLGRWMERRPAWRETHAGEEARRMGKGEEMDEEK